jgi:hypothetical protein
VSSRRPDIACVHRAADERPMESIAPSNLNDCALQLMQSPSAAVHLTVPKSHQGDDAIWGLNKDPRCAAGRASIANGDVG